MSTLQPYNNATHPGLEVGDLVIREGICLCNDWNQIHPGVKLTHKLDINRLEPRRSLQCKRSAKWPFSFEGTHE